MSKSVVIITPTIGSIELKQCIDSVWAQTYPNVRHLVVVDGPKANYDFVDHSNETLISYLCGQQHMVDYILLPNNVGWDGWYGHRVYASLPYLVNEDIVIFLDQDNWLEPEHVLNMVSVIEQGYDWAYSLRSIYDKDGSFVCQDNCESLGKYSTAYDYRINHIDTSCYAVPREILVRGICGAWYGKWGADRQFFNVLKQHYPNFGCTGQHTLNYRLSGNPNSPTKEFFLKGNELMKQEYSNIETYKWENKVT